MFNIVILGPAGSGKGIQSGLLTKCFNIPHISTGDMLRNIFNSNDENSNALKKSLEGGSLMSDEFMFDILLRRLKEDDCKNGFILDGFPRNHDQAMWLESVMPEINDKKLVVVRTSMVKSCGAVYNKFYENTKVEGVCDKCGSTDFFVREDDSDIDSIKKRLDIFKNMSKSIIDFYSKKNLIYFINVI